MLTITPAYAALLGVLFLVLSARVITWRRSRKIALGDWSDPEMVKRARVHGNFAEYAPFGLVLVVLVELKEAPTLLVHVLAAALLTGRFLHAAAFAFQSQILAFRVAGMVLTTTSIGASAAVLLVLSF